MAWDKLSTYEKFRYKQMVDDVSKTHDIDPNLVMSVINQESGFNQAAVSHAGATGLMQLMPPTARDLGVDPADEFQNLEGGVRYLKQNINRFKSVPLGLAAYNAGPGNVKKHGGIPPFRETKNYVKNIMGSYSSKKKSIQVKDRTPKSSTGRVMYAEEVKNNNDAYERARQTILERDIAPTGKPTSVYESFRQKELTDEQVIDNTRRADMYDQHKLRMAEEEENRTRPTTGWTVASQVPRGAALGFANLAGLSVDAANTALGVIGLNSEHPMFGSEQLRDLVTVDSLAPQGAAERIVSRTSEAFGENLAAMFLPLIAGSQYANELAPFMRARTQIQNGKLVATGKPLMGARFNQEIIRKVGQSLNELNKIALAHPQRFLLMEQALATTGGISAALVEELFPNNKVVYGNIAEIVGTIGAGSLANIMGRMAKNNVVSRTVTELMPGAASTKLDVADMLSKATSDSPIYEGMREHSETAWQRAGMPTEPTTAQITGQPGLAKLERLATVDPQFAATLKEREVLNNQRIRKLSDNLIDQWKQPPIWKYLPSPKREKPGITDIKTPIERDLKARQQDIEIDTAYEYNRLLDEEKELTSSIDTSFENVEKAVSRLPSDSKDLAGSMVRDALETAKKEFHEEASQKYNELNLTSKWDITPLVHWKENFISSATEAQKQGGLIPRSLNVVEAWSKKKQYAEGVPLQELLDLRTLIADDIRMAKYGENPNTKLSRSLAMFYGEVDGLIDNAIPIGSSPEQVADLRQVQDWYRKELGKYEKGVSAKVLEKNKQGEYKLYDSKVIGAYIKANDAPGQKEAYTQFKAWSKNVPDVKEAIRQYALSDVLAVKDNKLINNKRAAAWLTQYDRVMNDFPELKREIFDLKKIYDEATEIAAAKQLKIKEVRKKAANLWGQADKDIAKLMGEYGILDYEGHNFVSRIMDSVNPEKHIDSFLKQSGRDKAAMDGFRILAWEDIVRNAQGSRLDDVDFPLLRGEKIKEVLAEPKWKHFIKNFYTVNDIEKMQTIADVSNIISKAPKETLRINMGKEETLFDAIGTITMQKFGRAVTMKSKYIVVQRLVKFISKFKREKQIELLNEALLNPQVYDNLVSMSEAPKVSKEAVRKLIGNIYVLSKEGKPDKELLEEYTPEQDKEEQLKVRPIGVYR